MSRYASGTKTGYIASHMQLRSLLKRFGASESGSQDHGNREIFMFSKDGLVYKFEIDMPDDEGRISVDHNYRPGLHGTKTEYEKARKMRVLVAVVKAKLVAVEEGVLSFESEFLPQVVTDNGQTVAERWGPQIKQESLRGNYPKALPGFGGTQ